MLSASSSRRWLKCSWEEGTGMGTGKDCAAIWVTGMHDLIQDWIR